MMKRVMMLAVAALAVCTAQAVTINWGDSLTGSSITGGGTSYDFAPNIANPGAGGTVSAGAIKLTATFTVPTTISGWAGSLLQLGEVGNNRGVGLYLGQNSASLVGQMTASNGGTQDIGAVNGGATLTSGAHTFIIAVERSDPQGINIAIFMDGEKCFAADWSGSSDATGGGWWIGALALGSKGDGSDDLAQVTYADESVYYSSGTTIADVEASLVPEPTMLALLALGVAGLALRRRAA